MDKREKFIKKALEVHEGENLDYSEVVYVNNRTPVKIIDHDLDENGVEYGEFWQTPYNHLRGQSNPQKRSSKISKSKSFKQEEIIKRFKEVHKDENLDYSQVIYKNMHTKVKIIDHDIDENGVEYGEFWQEPCVHLKGCTNPRKAKDIQAKKSRYTTEEFIEKCKALYEEDKYSYDKVAYVNSKTKIKVFCNKIGNNGKPHGYFDVSPDLFLMNKGCQICGHHLSKNELEIGEHITSLIGKEEVIRNDTTLLNGLELDIYIPKCKFAIEYNGLRWHTEKFGKDRNYHLNKTEKCLEKGVTLFQIYEDEYCLHKDLVFDKIDTFLKMNYLNCIKIGARKCVIREITREESKQFLNKYHLQGYCDSTVRFGAFYDDKLISVMTFKEEKKNSLKWELNRFCTDYHYICQGVGSRLLKKFIDKYDPKEIKSFLDRRWCVDMYNNFYTKSGFKLEKALKPDYQYTLGKLERKHKFGFRKNILHKRYGFPLSMTESEMVKKLGYERIWNCGLLKYVLKR